jgi:hypothetical protein
MLSIDINRREGMTSLQMDCRRRSSQWITDRWFTMHREEPAQLACRSDDDFEVGTTHGDKPYCATGCPTFTA